MASNAKNREAEFANKAITGIVIISHANEKRAGYGWR